MRETDVIIVGGGPAGASCAWRLQRHGIDCLVLDRARFPRLKLCAGWITPDVVRDLELDAAHYPHGFLTFRQLHVHAWGLSFKAATTQHSIRRYEFDNWLLQRSGAEVIQHTVKTIELQGDDYVVDGAYRGRYLVGAGGSRCPVFRSLFRERFPRVAALQTAVLEQEFEYAWQDGDCHLWFFFRGLPGYAWYVPKENGWLNIGIGAMSAKLARHNDDIRTYWQRFVTMLADTGMVLDRTLDPKGYSYYLRSRSDIPRVGNAFVVGDAAGMATRDMCEGIGPAVQSGLHAADAIAGVRDYSLQDVSRYSLPNTLLRRFIDRRFTGGA